MAAPLLAGPLQAGTRWLALVALVGAAALAACGRVIAPAPPAGTPDTATEGRIEGIRSVIAPRAARRMQDMGFTTRRFSTDSMWGWRAQEQIAARMRFANAAGDSTRVFLELWGPCPENRRGCLRREAQVILGSLIGGESAPQ
jgi:hypothetical protein